MGFGDQSGSKLSTAKTYLADAHDEGAELRRPLPAAADHHRGRPRGRGRGRSSTRRRRRPRLGPVTVRAPVVVVACGSIESPALLLRSGIGGPAAGDYLRLHPTVAVTGYYDEPQDWMWGRRRRRSRTSSPTSAMATGS